MDTKLLFYTIIILTIICGCKTNNSTVNDNVPYKLVSYQDTTSFTYSPNLSIVNDKDVKFSKYLLSSLDSSLLLLQFKVFITEETVIQTNLKKSTNVVIYDFVGNKDKIKPIFKDKTFIDSFIGIYKAPVFCRFILTDSTLCAICCTGINIDSIIDNKLFFKYIEKDTPQRLNKHLLKK